MPYIDLCTDTSHCTTVMYIFCICARDISDSIGASCPQAAVTLLEVTECNSKSNAQASSQTGLSKQ